MRNPLIYYGCNHMPNMDLNFNVFPFKSYIFKPNLHDPLNFLIIWSRSCLDVSLDYSNFVSNFISKSETIVSSLLP